MTNKPFTLTAALTNTLTTNIMNPPTLTGGVGITETKTYVLVTHVRVLNKTAGAITFSLWRGATGANTAGTEFIGNGVSVAANSYVDWYGRAYFRTADFLVGGASANTSLTIEIEGEIGVAD